MSTGSSRPQDAIATILASMNTTGAEAAEYHTAEVTGITSDGADTTDRLEILPVNLATSTPQVKQLKNHNICLMEFPHVNLILSNQLKIMHKVFKIK